MDTIIGIIGFFTIVIFFFYTAYDFYKKYIFNRIKLNIKKVFKKKNSIKNKTNKALKIWQNKFLKELEEKMNIEDVKIEKYMYHFIECKFGNYNIYINTRDEYGTINNGGYTIKGYIEKYWKDTKISFLGKDIDTKDKGFLQEVCTIFLRKQLEKLEKERKERLIQEYYEFMKVYDDMMFDFEGIEIKNDEFKETFKDAERLKEIMLEAEKIHSKYK